MTESVSNRVDEMRRMGIKALRALFRDLFRYEPPRWLHRGALSRRVIWQEQALAEGGLSDSTKARLDELARDPELKVFPDPAMAAAATEATAGEKRSFRFRAKANPRLPLPGTVLVRQYRGREIRVTVMPDGLEFEGKRYGSLSQIANLVTQTHTSGLAWFGLARPRGEAKAKEGTNG